MTLQDPPLTIVHFLDVFGCVNPILNELTVDFAGTLRLKGPLHTQFLHRGLLMRR